MKIVGLGNQGGTQCAGRGKSNYGRGRCSARTRWRRNGARELQFHLEREAAKQENQAQWRLQLPEAMCE